MRDFVPVRTGYGEIYLARSFTGEAAGRRNRAELLDAMPERAEEIKKLKHSKPGTHFGKGAPK